MTHEPEQHDRAKDRADVLRSFALHHEQAEQDSDAEGKDRRRELRGIELHTFDSAQHRDGGRDHAVAVKEGGPNQTEDKQRGPPTSGRGMADVEQRQQGHDAALAAVVRAHDQDRVFERDDEDQ